MGKIAIPDDSVVGIDTNTLIYHVEQHRPYSEICRPLWDKLDKEKITVITSELSYLEAMTMPVRNGSVEYVERYRAVFFGVVGFSLVPITFAVWNMAIYLRAFYKLKSPDAIHAATALIYRCNMFVTNDPDFKRVPGLNPVVLCELVEKE
jgi:predicted nucleic acid-binding protein